MIDTHCHLFEEYYKSEEVIKNMGNNIMIVSGVDAKTNMEVLKLCHKYANVYGTLGIHPSEIDSYTDEDISFIEQHIKDNKIVAIGEIGLDYYYDSDRDKQKQLFIKQLSLASKYGKTIVIHSRDAINDTYEILKQYAKDIKKVMHCYSSSYEMALKLIDLNCIFGFGGTITFKNNVKALEVIEKLNLENIVLETDSPYLTPEPYRGKQNEPYNIIYVAKKIAQIKGISEEEVITTTTLTALRQFDLNIDL